MTIGKLDVYTIECMVAYMLVMCVFRYVYLEKEIEGEERKSREKMRNRMKKIIFCKHFSTKKICIDAEGSTDCNSLDVYNIFRILLLYLDAKLYRN